MGIEYIINNADGALTEQYINGSLSATTVSAETLYITSVGSGTPQINLGLDSNFQVVTGTTLTPINNNALNYIFNKFSDNTPPTAEQFDSALDFGFYLPKSINISSSLDSDIYVLASVDTFTRFIGDDILLYFQTCRGNPENQIGFLSYLKDNSLSYFKVNKPTSFAYYSSGSTLQCLEDALTLANYPIADNTYSLETQFNTLIDNEDWDYDNLYTTSAETKQRLTDKGLVEYGSIEGESQITKLLDYVSNWSGKIYFDINYGNALIDVNGTLIPNLGFNKPELLDRILDKGLVILKINYSYNNYQSDYLLVCSVETFLSIFFSTGPSGPTPP